MTEAWTTRIGGEPVGLPMTIESVRAALPEEERAEFTAQIESTPGPQLAQVLATWALPAPAWEQIEADIARLKAGDHSGFHPQDERYVSPEVA
ncbi:hypothetical protein GCM10010232_67770 [Streptomyces amakusaensis]|uniref:Uncharacterized protein n=1 Tax=Streptomyces amakusaensis TaxID=67271 RepID=A0ABW0ASJ0_9ACTN